MEWIIAISFRKLVQVKDASMHYLQESHLCHSYEQLRRAWQAEILTPPLNIKDKLDCWDAVCFWEVISNKLGIECFFKSSLTGHR